MLAMKLIFSNIINKLYQNKNIKIYIGLFFLLLMNLRVSFGVGEYTDLTTELGTYFIGLSQKPWSAIFEFSASWGPLYAMWLKIVGWFHSDVIGVYYSNIVLLSILSSFAIFLYINKITKNSLFAVIVSFVWMICQLNLPLNAKMAEFAIILIVFGLYISSFLNTNSSKLYLLSCFLLLASYVRPEFFTGFIVCVITAIIFNFIDKGNVRYNWLSSLFAFLPIVIIKLFGAFPFLSGGTSRSLLASKEHFIKNWYSWGNGSQIPNNLSYSGRMEWVWDKEFDGAKSIIEAFFSSPYNMLRHIFCNIKNLLVNLFESVFNHFPIIIPSNSYKAIRFESILFTAIFFFVIAIMVINKKHIVRFWNEYKFELLKWAIICLGPIAGSVIIFPNGHYLLAPAVFILTIFALGLNIMWNKSISNKQFTVSLVILLFITPNAFRMPHNIPNKEHSSRMYAIYNVKRPALDSMRFLYSLDIKENVSVTSFSNGFEHYIPKHMKGYAINYMRIDDFTDFVKNDARADILFIPYGEKGIYFYDKKQYQYDNFLKEYGRYGYIKLVSPMDARNVIFIRNHIKLDYGYKKKLSKR